MQPLPFTSLPNIYTERHGTVRALWKLIRKHQVVYTCWKPQRGLHRLCRPGDGSGDPDSLDSLIFSSMAHHQFMYVLEAFFLISSENIRGTPAVGKSTLVYLLDRYMLMVKPYIVIYNLSWPLLFRYLSKSSRYYLLLNREEFQDPASHRCESYGHA